MKFSMTGQEKVNPGEEEAVPASYKTPAVLFIYVLVDWLIFSKDPGYCSHSLFQTRGPNMQK
jgi:hypothetical protein